MDQVVEVALGEGRHAAAAHEVHVVSHDQLAREGQEVVIKDGYFPISAKIAATELKKVGIGVAP